MVPGRSPDSLSSRLATPLAAAFAAVMMMAVAGCSTPRAADSTRPIEPDARTSPRSAETSVADQVEQFVARVQPSEQGPRVVWLDAGMGPAPDTSMDEAPTPASGERDSPSQPSTRPPQPPSGADPKLFIAGAPDDAEPAPARDRVAGADAPESVERAPVVEIDATVDSESISDLTSQVLADDRSPFARALRTAALSAARGRGELDASALASLDARQRRAVRQYHRLVTTVSAAMEERSEPLTLEMLQSALQDVLDTQPLRIRHAELCRRVSGYGVYDPVPAAFVRGRPIRTIVYIELDNFTSVERSPTQYEVQLSQELVLYNESDGAAVWSHDPVRIVDKSRNERRDFFTVQLITLPAELNVGKYLLKVRITDHHAESGGAVCERSIPITIVASDAMVDRSP